MTTLVTLWFVFFVGFKQSCETRLLENHIMIGPGNPSTFDPELSSVIAAAGCAVSKDLAEENARPYNEDVTKPWSSSAENATNENNMLNFKFKENRTGADEKKESPQIDEVVYNVLPKGKSAPSVPSPRGNDKVNGQRLSASPHSPTVGHMKISNSAESRQSGGVVDYMQKEKGVDKKRILRSRQRRSTPSEGGGH